MFRMGGSMRPIIVRLEGGEKYQRLLGGEPATRGMKSGNVTLKPGESVGEHSTSGREEAIIILEGEAEVTCGSDKLAAGADTLVYIPPETPHDVRNPGAGPLRYVYVVSPVKI